MEELLIKYNSLDSVLQHQVIEFVDYLLSTQKMVKRQNLSAYKKRILAVSTWSEQDCQIFEENKKYWEQWKIDECCGQLQNML